MDQIKAPPVALPLLLVALGMSGCAGNDARPAAGFAAAQASIEQAERANAQRWAPNELSSARDNLRLAEDAQEEGEEELAARFAMRAQLDAELAAATAGNREVQSAVDELHATLDTLRRETARGSGDTGSSSGGSAPPGLQ